MNGKIEEITTLMENRNLKVLGVAETRLKGNGRKTVHNDYELVFSGNDADTRHGVGIFFDPE